VLDPRLWRQPGRRPARGEQKPQNDIFRAAVPAGSQQPQVEAQVQVQVQVRVQVRVQPEVEVLQFL